MTMTMIYARDKAFTTITIGGEGQIFPREEHFLAVMAEALSDRTMFLPQELKLEDDV